MKTLKQSTNPGQSVNKAIFILHLFNRLQIDLEVLDPVIACNFCQFIVLKIVIMKDYHKHINGKNFGYLIRMILRNGKVDILTEVKKNHFPSILKR
jgi:hypothetical protein